MLNLLLADGTCCKPVAEPRGQLLILCSLNYIHIVFLALKISINKMRYLFSVRVCASESVGVCTYISHQLTSQDTHTHSVILLQSKYQCHSNSSEPLIPSPSAT